MHCNPKLNGTRLAPASNWTHIDHFEGVAYIHLRSASNNCYLCRIERG